MNKKLSVKILWHCNLEIQYNHWKWNEWVELSEYYHPSIIFIASKKIETLKLLPHADIRPAGLTLISPKSHIFHACQKEMDRNNDKKLVSWYFGPSQPQRIYIRAKNKLQSVSQSFCLQVIKPQILKNLQNQSRHKFIQNKTYTHKHQTQNSLRISTFGIALLKSTRG